MNKDKVRKIRAIKYDLRYAQSKLAYRERTAKYATYTVDRWGKPSNEAAEAKTRDLLLWAERVEELKLALSHAKTEDDT